MLQPVQVSQSPESKFREFLASRPKPQRYTKPQQETLHFIFAAHDQYNHFDAEQLSADMERAGLNVSRATVYRTLNKFVDAGLLRRLTFGPRDVYEHDYGYPQHEHLYCQHCGKMIEFESPELESVVGDICREHQFQPSSHSLIVRGTCSECNRSRVTKRRLDLI